MRQRLVLGLYYLAVLLMAGGFVLMLLTWVGAENEKLEKYGLRAFITGFMVAYLWQFLFSAAVQFPQSNDGYPVEPSGVWIDRDQPLELGSRVLAPHIGKWWRAEVKEARPSGQVLVHFIGWDTVWDQVFDQSKLQVDEEAPRTTPETSIQAQL